MRVDTWKEFDHNVITHSAAHHLMAVGDLVSKLGYARVSDVARELNITRGSVSISLRPLKDSGLIAEDENKHLRLSEKGRQLVSAIKTKRLVFQRLLADLLGVDPVQAEIDACKIEHLVSNESARRVVSFLKYMDSSNGRARDFLAGWSAFDPSCEHSPSACPSCKEGCMAQNVTG
jgi:DtxR family Mn-dependent transcriptional regulator